MRLSDARIIINYLKIQTDNLATEIEEQIPLDSKDTPDPLVVEKLAKISCKLANHKLAVEMLEQYYEIAKVSSPADGAPPPQTKESSQKTMEKELELVSDSDRVIVKRHSNTLGAPPPEIETALSNLPDEDTLFDPWRDSND